jgi:hypothetical protein
MPFEGTTIPTYRSEPVSRIAFIRDSQALSADQHGHSRRIFGGEGVEKLLRKVLSRSRCTLRVPLFDLVRGIYCLGDELIVKAQHYNHADPHSANAKGEPAAASW